MDESNLPPHLSPDCLDMEFEPGLVRTRPGLSVAFNTLNPENFIGLDVYTDLSLAHRLFALSSTGVLRVESGISLAVVQTLLQLTSSQFASWRMSSVSLFGRQYIAVSDGKTGVFPPLQYDGTNLDRMSPAPPDAGALLSATENLAAGSITAGVHKVVTIFESRTGHRKIDQGVGGPSWTASGGRTVDIANIPIGPAWVARRILAFTGAGGSSFYFIPGSRMIIDDNSTTSVSALDFDDQSLFNTGTNVDNVFLLIELPPVAGLLPYRSRSRMVAWGELARVQGFDYANWSFDSGFTSAGLPFGWTEDVAGEGKESTIVVSSGFALKLTTTGNPASVPRISQANPMKLGPNIGYLKNVRYRVRAWVNFGGVGNSRLNINLDTAGADIGIQVSSIGFAGGWTLLDAQLTPPNANISSATRLRIYIDQPAGGSSTWYVDDLSVYPASQPSLSSVVRVSAPEAPEDFDGVNGFLIAGPNDGQAVRSCFELRGFLFIVKENATYVTEDNGLPAITWSVRQLSKRVGTPSVRGVGLGDEWVVIADRDGLYYFDGGEPEKVSQEIQPTWDQINWQYGHLLAVEVDTKRKRIYVSAPMGAATSPSRILTLDYTEGFGDPIQGGGRKWCPWAIAAPSLALAERPDGAARLFLGSGSSTGKVYALDPATLNDDGATIAGYWRSGYFQDKSGTRFLWGYLTSNVVGAGFLALTIMRGHVLDPRPLRPWRLLASGFNNQERIINEQRERVSVKFQTSGSSDWFSLQGTWMWARPSPWAPVRGVNTL